MEGERDAMDYVVFLWVGGQRRRGGVCAGDVARREGKEEIGVRGGEEVGNLLFWFGRLGLRLGLRRRWGMLELLGWGRGRAVVV